MAFLTDVSFDVIAPEHAAPLYDLLRKNRDFLGRWLPWVDGVTSVEDTTAFIEKVMKQNDDGRGPHYSILSAGRVAGIAGFHPVDWPNRNSELGYWLGEEFSGQGLATAACRLLLHHGFADLGLNRIEIRCAKGNKSSIAVAERLGMTYEGTLREEEFLNNKYVDHMVYSILSREYEEQTREQR